MALDGGGGVQPSSEISTHNVVRNCGESLYNLLSFKFFNHYDSASKDHLIYMSEPSFRVTTCKGREKRRIAKNTGRGKEKQRVSDFPGSFSGMMISHRVDVLC